MTDQDKAEKAALETRLAKAEKDAADAIAKIATEKTAMEARVAKAEKDAADAAQSAAFEKALREQVEIEKRADATIPLIKGDVKVRAAILKAVDGIADEPTRKAAHEALVGANGAYELLAKATGHGGGSTVDANGDAKATLTAKLAEFAKAAGKTPEAATADFVRTKEGAQLYAAAYPR